MGYAERGSGGVCPFGLLLQKLLMRKMIRKRRTQDILASWSMGNPGFLWWTWLSP